MIPEELQTRTIELARAALDQGQVTYARQLLSFLEADSPEGVTVAPTVEEAPAPVVVEEPRVIRRRSRRARVATDRCLAYWLELIRGTYLVEVVLRGRDTFTTRQVMAWVLHNVPLSEEDLSSQSGTQVWKRRVSRALTALKVEGVLAKGARTHEHRIIRPQGGAVSA